MWMKVICLRPFILCIVIGIFVSQVNAQSYKCELRPNGYAAAFTSLNQNLSRKVQEDFLISISPRSFEVNENFVKVGNSQQVEVSGGDREKSFHVRVNTNIYRLTYYINIDPFTGNGNVYIVPQSYYNRVGPIRYSCNSIGKTSSRRFESSNSSRQEFNKLSTCNKRYVQQFLKGQSLYSGSIDGLWGSGTSEGLEKAKQLPAFKGLSTIKIFEKLKNNPVC